MGGCTSSPVQQTSPLLSNEEIIERSKTTLSEVQKKHGELEDLIQKKLDLARAVCDTAKAHRMENRLDHTQEYLKRYKFIKKQLDDYNTFRDKYGALIRTLEQYIHTSETVVIMEEVNKAMEGMRGIVDQYEEENDRLKVFEDHIADVHVDLGEEMSESEFDEIVQSLDEDSLKEIAKYLRDQTVRIVTQRYKADVLIFCEQCIRDNIQQRDYEVQLADIMEAIRSACIAGAKTLFEQMERKTTHIDYSRDAINGSPFEEMTKVSTIMAFSTDSARKFVRDEFVRVLVDWAYSSILMKNQVQTALQDCFDKTMTESILLHSKQATGKTATDVFDKICEDLIAALSEVIKAEFVKYAAERAAEQHLQDLVGEMATNVEKYDASQTSADSSAVALPSFPLPETILPPPIPTHIVPSVPASTAEAIPPLRPFGELRVDTRPLPSPLPPLPPPPPAISPNKTSLRLPPPPPLARKKMTELS